MLNQFHVHSSNRGLSNRTDKPPRRVKSKRFIIARQEIHSNCPTTIDARPIEVRSLPLFVDLIVLFPRYDSELRCSFHWWQHQLSRRSHFGSISIRVFCKCQLIVRGRHCARLWNSSPMRKANVMNNTFRPMNSICLLMKHVEISWRENQPSY